MTYTTAMVALSIDSSNRARLEVAGQLAERFSARVIGITAAEYGPPLYFTSGRHGQELVEQGRAAIKTGVAQLESEFRKAMQNRCPEAEWRCAEDFPSRYIVEQARACDIIVVGEAGRGDISDPFAEINPSDLVMQAGRPLLVVANDCDWLDLRSVLIGWKDTAEARRAAADALPLLRKATDVSVVEVVEEESHRAAALSRVRDVVAWLARHGVRASELVPEQCGEPTAQLERIAGELGAGVIVAGAYGHSRLHEWVLGGVTRRLVNPSSRCSLLSR
jgi:nucleotide-binding universal stress UspA family protein